VEETLEFFLLLWIQLIHRGLKRGFSGGIPAGRSYDIHEIAIANGANAWDQGFGKVVRYGWVALQEKHHHLNNIVSSFLGTIAVLTSAVDTFLR
jgi:hypothetical protein